MKTEIENVLTSHAYSLPLRCEVAAITRILNSQPEGVKTGLDIGFTNPGVSRHFRKMRGYWMTVEPTVARRDLVAEELGDETVLCMGENGELPFEDRQFDAVLLAQRMLPAGNGAVDMIHECHRVMKTGGVFILTVASRKRFGLARFLGRKAGVSGTIWYTEKEIFDLLKGGFDVLGFHYSCRFWVQMVRQWADNRKSGWHGASNFWLRFLYGLAWLLDLPLFLTRGYQMTVFGRRKGWRDHATRMFKHSTPVSDAMLFNPKYSGDRISWDKFR